mgnify:FL=1
MRSLYILLLKYKDHVVFILAIILSLSFLLKNDSPNVYLIRGKISDYLSFFNYPISWVKNMSQLQNETQLLREKNIQLSLQLESFIFEHEENKRLKELLNYKRESSLELLPAKIINMGSSSSFSSFTLDVGKNNGVNVNQAVLAPQGILGKTLIVGNKSTIVQSINDVNFRLSVRIYPSGATGILRYLINDICEIRELQKNANINVGDRVVSSGFSTIYPENLPVGKVTEILDERGSLQKVARIKIGSDIGSILSAFVIVGEINAKK